MTLGNNNNTKFNGTSTVFPERILQFGHGDVLGKFAGITDDFISEDEMPNSSVVVVTSDSQSADLYKTKDSKISRILCAKDQWPDILAFAADPEFKIIFLKKRLTRKDMLRDNIYLSPPFSLPGKLLSLLFTRFKKFGSETDKGVAIVSADGDHKNPEIVQSVLLEVAHLNEMSPSFIDWIENTNRFYSIYK